jgi:uncharacterized protein YkwD
MLSMPRRVIAALTLAFAASAAGAFAGQVAEQKPYLVMPTKNSSSSISSKKAVSSSSKKLTPNEKMRDEIVTLVNAERKKNNVPALKTNPLLMKAAQGFADDMVKLKFFAHEAPDGSTPESRVRATGYFETGCTTCAFDAAFGENIGKGVTAKAVMDQWMKSPVHKANILRADFREIGVGQNGSIWVQVFGKLDVKR